MKPIYYRLAKAIIMLAIAGLLLLLGGCVYSNQIKQDHAIASSEFIVLVQNAVDRYQKRTGVLPIKNKEQDTPIYEKYIIDFKKLQNYNMLSNVPTNAFENGGTAIYVLINPETKPEVKIMDLQTYQKMVDLQGTVDQYKSTHNGQLPWGDVISPSFYVLDFTKLGQKSVQIQSPYSRQYLSIVVSKSGRLAVDYAPEIMKAMTKTGVQSPDSKLDLRSFLVSQAYFVPAWSYPYYWNNGEPVLTES